MTTGIFIQPNKRCRKPYRFTAAIAAMLLSLSPFANAREAVTPANQRPNQLQPPFADSAKPRLSNEEFAKQICFTRMQEMGCYELAETDLDIRASLRDCDSETLISTGTFTGIGLGAWHSLTSLVDLALTPFNLALSLFDNRDWNASIDRCFKSHACRIALQRSSRFEGTERILRKDPKTLTREDVSDLMRLKQLALQVHRNELEERGRKLTMKLAKGGVAPDSPRLLQEIARLDPEVAVYRKLSDPVAGPSLLAELKGLQKSWACSNGEVSGEILGSLVVGPTVIAKVGGLFFREVSPSPKLGAAQTAAAKAISAAQRRLVNMDGMPVSSNTLILDANLAITLKRARIPGLVRKEKAILDDILNKLNFPMRDVRVTPRAWLQVKATREGETPVRLSRTRVTKDAAAKRAEIIEILEAAKVGGKTKGGIADREILAEAFTAPTTGATPTFVTADANVYNKLYTLSGGDPSRTGAANLAAAKPDGFLVEVAGRKLNILPISPPRAK